MYCQHCGNPIEAEAEIAEAEAGAVEVEAVSSAEVRIAEIGADRDVKIARINAGVAEVGEVAELAHAEGVAEGMIAAITPPAAEDPGAPAEIVIADDGADPGAEVDGNPPPDAGESAPPVPAGRGGMSWY